eukprot:2529632-Prymnesium_polylepis.1
MGNYLSRERNSISIDSISPSRDFSTFDYTHDERDTIPPSFSVVWLVFDVSLSSSNSTVLSLVSVVSFCVLSGESIPVDAFGDALVESGLARDFVGVPPFGLSGMGAFWFPPNCLVPRFPVVALWPPTQRSDRRSLNRYFEPLFIEPLVFPISWQL